MGLAAAYHALKAGHEVIVFEADSIPGGMAAHLDFDGLSIERFYHFICKADQPTFDLMTELGIDNKLRWRDTLMGYFMGGKMHRWGDPVALLTFPHLDLISKFRYGLQMFLATKRSDWSSLETRTAKEWFESGGGKRTYDILWRRLFDLKFFEYADKVGAAWIWTRIKRIGTSRRSLMQEQLGYIEGGSETLVQALVNAIEDLGGEIRCSTAVQEIAVENGAVKAVRTAEGDELVDAVISTIPTPYVSKTIPGLPEDWKAKYDAIDNVGVVCVLLKLKRQISKNFWVNIVHDGIEIPGIVEFSNLRPVKEHIVYVPFYMPSTHEKFSRDDAAFVDESMACLKILQPELEDEDLITSRVGRLKHAQPVCDAGFLSKLPPIQTPINGLQIADTCFYYPEDRGISESVRFGKMMAEAVGR